MKLLWVFTTAMMFYRSAVSLESLHGKVPINYVDKINRMLTPWPHGHIVNKRGRGPLAYATYKDGLTYDGHHMTTISAKKESTIQRYMMMRDSKI